MLLTWAVGVLLKADFNPLDMGFAASLLLAFGRDVDWGRRIVAQRQREQQKQREHELQSLKERVDSKGVSVSVSVVAAMRYLPWITLGFILPMAVSPTMWELWILRGTGNANYLFFQGMCMWLFSALALTEFVVALRTVASSADRVCSHSAENCSE